MTKTLLASIAALLLAVRLVNAQVPADPPTLGEPTPHLLPNDGSALFVDRCQPIPRVWLGADYLLWWVKSSPVPVPLVTTGDPANPFAGSIGQPGSDVLIGNSNFGYKAFSGFRLNGGLWLGASQTWAIDAGAFWLANRTSRQSVGSDANGSPGIFLPIKDVTVGEDSFTVAFPGSIAGTVTVSSSSRLWGAETNLLRSSYSSDRVEVKVFAGFRHLNLEERIEIARSVKDFGGLLADPTNPGNPEPAGSLLTTTDRFQARNLFYGGQLGIRATFDLQGGFYADVRGKLALGSTQQILNIIGTTNQQAPGGPVHAFPVGVLASPGHSGDFVHQAFSVVPEIEFKLGFQLTNSIRVFTGYNFLDWTNVIRPGNQINRTVDERALPTATGFVPGFQPVLPSPAFNQSNFWAQGLNFGLELRF